MFSLDPRLIATLVVAALIFAAGYAVNDYRRDSIELAAKKATDAEAEKYKQREADIATATEARLATLKVQERVIDRGIVKEVTKNETVYSSNCVTDDGRVLINSLARPARASASGPSTEVP